MHNSSSSVECVIGRGWGGQMQHEDRGSIWWTTAAPLQAWARESDEKSSGPKRSGVVSQMSEQRPSLHLTHHPTGRFIMRKLGLESDEKSSCPVCARKSCSVQRHF